MPTMIYHVPFPLQPGVATASQIRPVKMRQAFEDAGYRVIEVSGYAHERRRKIAFLKQKLREGLQVDFVYSEAASIPTSFTEAKHFPLHLFLDRDFFKALHAHDIPIGVFYRDIYWAFSEYVEANGKAVAAVMRRLYRWDLDTYNKYVKVLFLPSLKMGEYIPGLAGPEMVALPPGAPTAMVEKTNSAGVAGAGTAGPEMEGSGMESSGMESSPLQLLYVGNVGGSHYRITDLLEAIQESPEVSLKIITRQGDWENARQEYEPLMGKNVSVIHAAPEDLEEHYSAADIAMLYIQPQEYRDFAVPFKLFEYLGHGKPVIASAKTFAGQMIEQSGAGWTIPYSAEALKALLAQLTKNPEHVEATTRRAEEVGAENSWENRAREAAAALVN